MLTSILKKINSFFILIFLVFCDNEKNNKFYEKTEQESEITAKEFGDAMIRTNNQIGKQIKTVEKKMNEIFKNLNNIEQEYKKQILNNIRKTFKKTGIREDTIANFINQRKSKYDGYGLLDSLEEFDQELDKIIKNIDKHKNIISLITWNVWFEKHMRKERMEKIMEVVHKVSPDFVCFQEVKQDALKVIIENKGRYNLCGVNTMFKNGYNYDIVILSKLDSHKIERKKLTTNQGRNQLKCKFEINKNKINLNIITSHIESIFGQKSDKYKNAQIESILNEYNKNDYFVFLGDMNLLERDINPKLPNYVSDAFKAIGPPKSDEFSYNRLENKNLNNEYPPARLDRVYFSNKTLKIKKFQLLKDKIKNGKPPSDHFGIYCELELR
ncbi:MAG: hypothetical protein GY830_00590 [Bacteroidetes bacterium]|nr:hypothetical protein [Bacteroidota bacterium]